MTATPIDKKPPLSERLLEGSKTIAAAVTVATSIAGLFVAIASLAMSKRTGWPFQFFTDSVLDTAGNMVVDTVIDVTNTAADYLIYLVAVGLLIRLTPLAYKYACRNWPTRIPRLRAPIIARSRAAIVIAMFLIAGVVAPTTLIEDQMTESVLVQIARRVGPIPCT